MTTMKPMTYKGYAAQIEYSDEDACFVGHIAGLADVIGFHADNVTCPQSPYQSKFQKS